MKQYHNLIMKILAEGTKIQQRNSNTLEVFGHYMEFREIGINFPLVTTKKMFWRGIIAELLWFLSGSCDNKKLQEQGVHIWDKWHDDKNLLYGNNGYIEHIYGEQWRSFSSGDRQCDQIKVLLCELKNNPFSRRHIVISLNPCDTPYMDAPPGCHTLFQLNVQPSKLHHVLNCHVYQRSADVFLGLPWNIASYAALTIIFADIMNKTTGLKYKAGKLCYSIGSAHIYEQHIKQCKEILTRRPMMLPKMGILPGGINYKDTFFPFGTTGGIHEY